MGLYIRQRFFSWADSYDVYEESGRPKYEVKAEFFSFGHQIHVYDKQSGAEVGSIHEKLLTFLPKFDIVIGGRTLGSVRKEFTFLRPKYQVDYQGWEVTGDFMGWDYQVSKNGRRILDITKEVLNWTDTYALHFDDPADELPGLLLVLAIDAANCSGKE